MKRKIWIISDTHFNHKNIIQFEGRKKGFEHTIINKIKNNVGHKDILIHLGDVIFDRQSELEGYLKAMGNCTKVLVRGNHDKQNHGFYINKGFDFVCDRFDLLIGKVNYVFTHKPLQFSKLKLTEVNIHGHLHKNSHHIWGYINNTIINKLWYITTQLIIKSGIVKNIPKKKYILYNPESNGYKYMPVILNNLLYDK